MMARAITGWGEQADAFVVAQGVHAQTGLLGGLLNAERDHQGTIQPGVDSRSSGSAHLNSRVHPSKIARALVMSSLEAYDDAHVQYFRLMVHIPQTISVQI